ncbi:MAG TPA: hypothetical protein VFZ10_20650 [Geminicoccaceae bacterium]
MSTGIARLFRPHNLPDIVVAVLVRLVQDFDLITFLEFVELDARRLQTMGVDVVADADRAAKGIAKQLAASAPSRAGRSEPHSNLAATGHRDGLKQLLRGAGTHLELSGVASNVIGFSEARSSTASWMTPGSRRPVVAVFLRAGARQPVALNDREDRRFPACRQRQGRTATRQTPRDSAPRLGRETA